MEGDGWNLYGSFYHLYTNPKGSADVITNDFGFAVQSGMWATKHLEPYVRFDMTIPDSDRPLHGENFRTLTAGLNYYPFPKTDNIRFNTEFLYMFDAEAESIVEPNVFSSVRDSPSGDQMVVRTSFVIRW